MNDHGTSTLHLIQRPDAAALAACRDFCQAGDAVVLMGTGVLTLCGNDRAAEFPPGVRAYCMRPDALAHGMAGAAAAWGVEAIEDADLVRLVMDCRHCLGWK